MARSVFQDHICTCCIIIMVCWRLIVHEYRTKATKKLCERGNGMTRENIQLNAVFFSWKWQLLSDGKTNLILVRQYGHKIHIISPFCTKQTLPKFRKSNTPVKPDQEFHFSSLLKVQTITAMNYMFFLAFIKPHDSISGSSTDGARGAVNLKNIWVKLPNPKLKGY